MKRYILYIVLSTLAVNLSGQWLSDYSYRKEITIDAAMVSGTVNLTNYPLLVNLTENDLKSVFNGGLVFSDNGWDIRFTSDDGTTLLDHELELYTETTGELAAWVRIPSLSSSIDTKIYLYYGNQMALSDPSTSNTWNTNFRGVWHSSDNVEDASQFSNDGTNNGTISATGKIGNARSYDGIDDKVLVSNSPSLDDLDDVSIEAWIMLTDTTDYYCAILSKEDAYALWYAKYSLMFHIGNSNLEYPVTLIQDTWYHVAATYNESFQRIYLNGEEVKSISYTEDIPDEDNYHLAIGYDANLSQSEFTGGIDEVRILSIPLTEDWIKTSFNNQNNPATFYSLSIAEIANDHSCDAISLPVNPICSHLIFNNLYATDSGIPLSECEGYAGGDTWFSIEVPPSGNIFIKIESDAISQSPAFAGWAHRLGLAIYTGPCSNLTYDTCWIESNIPGRPNNPEMSLTGFTPGDTLFLRVWEYANDFNGKFRMCVSSSEINSFNLSGSGAYCSGSSGLTITLESSELGVDYQLKKNGIDQGSPLTGTGSSLSWPGQLEGIYEVVGSVGASSKKMNGKVIVIEEPLPVITFGYEFEKTIIIKPDSVSGTQNLINFPLLITFTADNDLRNTLNGGNVQNSNGYDIVFTDENFNPIPFERISYDPSTGAYSAWVKVPSLSYNTDTEIHMLYGNSGVTTDHSSYETWSNNYVQVMHLDGDFTDASLTGNYGMNDGTSDAPGKLGSGRRFDGTDDMFTVYDDPTLSGTNDEATFSLWVNFTDAGDGDHQFIMSTQNRFAGAGYEWASQETGNHFFYPNGNDVNNYNLSPNPFTDGIWHYLAVTLEYSTREVKLYMDGQAMTFTIENVPGLWSSLALLDNWLWGGNPDRNTRYFDGLMDEIRIQTVVRSEGWLLTEYTNQNNPSGFYTLSAESIYEPFVDVCQDNAPIILNQPKPLGGSFSGMGVVGTTFNPRIAGAGDHIISYTYTNGNGCVSIGSKTQTVHPIPSPTISGNNNLCPNALEETYSTPLVTGHSFNWTITGAGATITSGQATNQITVDWGSSSGTLKLIETIDATGCDSTTTDFIVTISDITDPLINCPSDVIEELVENCEFIIPDYSTLVEYNDNCDSFLNLTQSPAAGTILSGSGTSQEIILLAQDASGNEAECRFNILLQDNTLPVVVSLRDTLVMVQEGVYEVFISMPLPEFGDNCGIQSVVNDFNGGSDASGTYQFGNTTVGYTVTDVNGNSILVNQQIEVRFENEVEYGLVIPEGFSPNEDGLNDRFEILGIYEYPNNKLLVYNVYGNEVYSKQGYDNTWDGTSSNNLNKGGKLPSGTYYYIITLNRNGPVLKGSVYIRNE